LQHLVLERWSRGSSALHRLDPRAKAVALLVFLVALATAHRGVPLLFGGFLILLIAGLVCARLPLWGMFARAGLVLPFTLLFALISWAAGDPARGLSLVAKSYLSALAVLLVVATTPLPSLLGAFERSGVPRFLLMVVQFLYRYLFVIVEEGQHMRAAAGARGASARQWMPGGARFRAAGGALAVLLARSYNRAGHIHQAMLARGFQGHFQTLEAVPVRSSDVIFTVAASIVAVAWRLVAERVAW